MRIDFHLMGTERKALVRAISEIIGEEAEFTFTSGQKDTQHKPQKPCKHYGKPRTAFDFRIEP